MACARGARHGLHALHAVRTVRTRHRGPLAMLNRGPPAPNQESGDQKGNGSFAHMVSF